MAKTVNFRILARVIRAWRQQRNKGVGTAKPTSGRLGTSANGDLSGGALINGGLSRRAFLKVSTLGAVSSVGAMAGCAQGTVLFRRKDSPRIAIVGAGLAGLSCAYRLRNLGLDCTVYEATDRAGGRQFTRRGIFSTPQYVEWGGEFIDSNHVTIRALATELGLELVDFRDNELEWFIIEGERVSLATLTEWFVPLGAAIERVLEYSENSPEEYQKLDNTPLSTWLDGVSADVEPKLIRLIKTAYCGEFGLECEEQSSLNLLELIGTVDSVSVGSVSAGSGAENSGEFAIFGDSDERYRVHGGNDLIALRLSQEIQGCIEPGCKLLAISDDLRGIYHLTFQRESGNFEIKADIVVLAIPFSTLRKVDIRCNWTDDKRKIIRELGYGTNSKLFLGYSSRVWNDVHKSMGSVLTESDLQCCWETTRKQPGEQGVITVFKGGRAGEDLGSGTVADQAKRAVAQIEGIFPGTMVEHVDGHSERAHWPSAPFALGSYACFLVGQGTKANIIRKPEKSVYFAGEHCSVNFQGYMEGAVESGVRTAKAIERKVRRR